MIKVFHVELLSDNSHSYFGSKKAIFEHFKNGELGISYNSFRNIKNLAEFPYQNKNCIIRQGYLEQVKKEPNTDE